MTASKTARARARAELTSEIKAAARRQVAGSGAQQLSLRAVARELGMVSSALYRYFPSRDDLLTALILGGFGCGMVGDSPAFWFYSAGAGRRPGYLSSRPAVHAAAPDCRGSHAPGARLSNLCDRPHVRHDDVGSLGPGSIFLDRRAA